MSLLNYLYKIIIKILSKRVSLFSYLPWLTLRRPSVVWTGNSCSMCFKLDGFQISGSTGFVTWFVRLPLQFCWTVNLGDRINANKGRDKVILLSPSLFILVVDILAKILRRAGSLGLIEGIESQKDYVIFWACNLYIDDTLLFYVAKMGSVLSIKGILLAFEGASGLKINIYKSTIIYLNADEH